MLNLFRFCIKNGSSPVSCQDNPSPPDISHRLVVSLQDLVNKTIETASIWGIEWVDFPREKFLETIKVIKFRFGMESN